MKTKFILINPNYHEAVRETTIEADECSDGYHTFTELYKHRLALTVALFKAYDTLLTPLGTKVKCWKSKLHSDGTMFDGHFIVGLSVPQFEGPDRQITYHYKLDYWGLFNCMELRNAPEYDGHTPEDTINRLLTL